MQLCVTEAKLSKFADVLLSEISQGTVDLESDFDGTITRKNLGVTNNATLTCYLNGAMGIAVGMATDIPLHNLTEVVSTCVHLLSNPNASVKKLFGVH